MQIDQSNLDKTRISKHACCGPFTQASSENIGRTQFLAAATALSRPRQQLRPPKRPPRFAADFVTHVSVVRVNQIEVTPTRNLGEDEAADNSPERIRSPPRSLCRGLPRRQNDLGHQLARPHRHRARNTRKPANFSPAITTNTATKSPSSPAATSRPCSTRAKTTGRPSTTRCR